MASKVLWAKPVEGFALLSNDDPEEAVFKSRRRHLSKCSVGLIVFCSILAGFFLGCLTNGRASVPASGKGDVISCKGCESHCIFFATQLTKSTQVEKHPKVLMYNRTFSENSHNTALAWDSIFPKQGGYFSHPTIAPTRATFSVFHYLHCLVNIYTTIESWFKLLIWEYRTGFAGLTGCFTTKLWLDRRWTRTLFL